MPHLLIILTSFDSLERISCGWIDNEHYHIHHIIDCHLALSHTDCLHDDEIVLEMMRLQQKDCVARGRRNAAEREAA